MIVLCAPLHTRHQTILRLTRKLSMAAASESVVTLINSPVCPFGARANIATELHLKGAYDYKEASLTDKQPWFTEAYRSALGADPSSTGKVPVLQDGELMLCESAVVAEYIDEKFGGKAAPRLLPEDPVERAAARLFVNSFEGRNIKTFYGLLMAKPADRAELAAGRDQLMVDMSTALLAEQARSGHKGPFFFGDRLGWPEVMLYTCFARHAALKVHRGWEIKEVEETAAVRAWAAACAAHPAIAAVTSEDAFFVEALSGMAAKGDA